MNLLKAAIVGILGAVVAGLVVRGLIAVFPNFNAQFVLHGAISGASMGSVFWAIEPKNKEAKAGWGKLALSSVLSQATAFVLGIPATFLVLAASLDEGQYAPLVVRVLSTGIMWWPSWAIATRILRETNTMRNDTEIRKTS